MKIKFFVFLFLIAITTSLYGQLAVEAPGVESVLTAQTVLMTRMGIEEKIREKAHYLEYIAKFVQIMKTINFTTSTIRNIARLGKALKEKTAKEWLDDARTALGEASPEFRELKREAIEIGQQGKASYHGKFFDYVSHWDHKSLDFHAKLAENYEKHVMFPELFPLSSEARGWKTTTKSAVIQKAWMEAGMEEEIGDDMLRRRIFGQYYDAYQRQAKANENLEALGISRLLQAAYISAEDINHLKKNSDIEVMEKQYAKDMMKADKQRRIDAFEKDTKEANKKDGGVFGIGK